MHAEPRAGWKDKSTAVIGSLLLALAGGLFLTTLNAPGGIGGAAFSAMFFPRVVLMLWMALAAGLVVAAWRHADLPFVVARPASTASLAAAMALYAISMPFIGFVPATVAWLWIAPLCFGYRRPLPILLFGVMGAAAMWLVLGKAMRIPLPYSPFDLPF